MKKLLLSITALGFFLNAVSQSVSGQSQAPIYYPCSPKVAVAPFTGDEIPLVNINTSTAAVSQRSSSMPPPCLIAQTTYDLQSNGSSDNRIYNKSVGVAGTCTGSQTYDLAAADRGTFYNFSGTSVCSGFGPVAIVKEETDRRGWPSIDYSEIGGFEAFVSHNGTTTQPVIGNGIKLSKRSPAGSGAWVETQLPPADDDSSIIFLWARMRIGGANGITIHEIDLSLPTGNGGVIYHDMDGVLTYSRSQDGGVTWDIRHMILPDIDTSLFKNMSGDSYSIDAAGDNVAICYGEPTGDWCIWKSTDNGTNWTRIVIRQFALPGYGASQVSDTTGDGIADTLSGTDGTNAVLIDNNGMIHSWAGYMRMINDGSVATYNYFPGENTLLYWNESMGAMPASLIVAGYCQDLNSNGTLDLEANTPGTYPGCNLATMPSAGIDATGNIYLAYMSPVENTTNGIDQSYWQIFLKASADGGVTWTPDMNIINDPFTEAVFPSVARNVGACVPLVWQQDAEPGLAVRGDMDPYVLNDILFDCIVVPTGIQNTPAPASMMSVYPNPASDYIKLNYSFEQSELVNVNISNVLGQSVYQNETKMVSGTNSLNVDLKNFHAGVYFVNTTVGEKTYTTKFVVE